ncbi:hypothetical protein [Falsiruegeria mediterranea]
MRSLLVPCAAALALVPSVCQAQATSGHQVIRDFGRALYVLGETTGGSPEDWAQTEEAAVNEINRIQDTEPEALFQPDEEGRTPLMRAAGRGYAVLVAALLQDPEVRNRLGAKDAHGLDAYGYAALRRGTSQLACHPETTNPFVLIPFVVTRHYFADRAPYGQILHMLAAAGADPNPEDARAAWLAICSNDVASDRQLVATSKDLGSAIAEVQHRVMRRKERADVDETADLMRTVFAGRVAEGKMTQAELDQTLADYYRSKGFEPPQNEQD